MKIIMHARARLLDKEVKVEKEYPCTTDGLREALDERRSAEYSSWPRLEVRE